MSVFHAGALSAYAERGCMFARNAAFSLHVCGALSIKRHGLSPPKRCAMHSSFTPGLIPCQFTTAHRFGQNCSFHAPASVARLCGRFNPAPGPPSTVPARDCASLLMPLVDTEQTECFGGNILCEVTGLGREQHEPAGLTRR